MSVHDAYMNAYAAPWLMEQLAKEAAITVITHGGQQLVTDATAILAQQKITNIFDGTKYINVIEMKVTLLIDGSSSFKGLPGNHVNANAIIDGELWSIESVEAKCDTFQVLNCRKDAGIGKTRSGFYQSGT